jgi:hypothetical protein
VKIKQMSPVETILRVAEGGIKSDGGVNLRCIVSTFVNVTMYHWYNNSI